jgi:hypothetical protein
MINGRGNSFRWPRNTLYPQRLALTSPTSGGCSVGPGRTQNSAKHSLYTTQCTELTVKGTAIFVTGRGGP